MLEITSCYRVPKTESAVADYAGNTAITGFRSSVELSMMMIMQSHGIGISISPLYPITAAPTIKNDDTHFTGHRKGLDTVANRAGMA